MNKITGRLLILNIDKDEDISNWASSDGDRIVTFKVAFYPFFIKILYIQTEFRGADFYPLEIFPKPNRDSDSVKNSESRDIKNLT